MNATKFYPYILALITLFFWGAAPIFGKIGLTKINPYIGLTIRSIVVTVIMVTIVLARGDFKELITTDLRSVAFISIEGIFASLIGHLAYYYALKLGETSRVVPITSAFPLITMFLAMLFLSEKITILKGSGAVLILVGIVLLRL